MSSSHGYKSYALLVWCRDGLHSHCTAFRTAPLETTARKSFTSRESKRRQAFRGAFDYERSILARNAGSAARSIDQIVWQCCTTTTTARTVRRVEFFTDHKHDSFVLASSNLIAQKCEPTAFRVCLQLAFAPCTATSV